MSSAPAADQSTAGDVHNLISAIKPDQERLAQLSKQLQQMEQGAGLMDKLKAFRHGGVENAMEKLRDQIADVKQGMFNKLAHDQSSASMGPDGGMSDATALKGQVAKYQDQLAIDDHFKQAGMPGLLDQGQRNDVEKLLREQTRKLGEFGQQQKNQEGPGHEKQQSVRAALGMGASQKNQQIQSVDTPGVKRSL